MFLTTSQVNTLVKTFAIAFEHRAFEPATPMGWAGLDASLEISAVKVPTEFTDALAAFGAGGGLPLPIFPSAKISAHKGLGSIDVGASGIWYLGTYIVGGDVKWNLFDPPEGINVAVRGNFTYAKIILLDPLIFTTQVISGEIIVSRQLGKYFDPYIGAGYHYAYGDVSASVTVTVGPFSQTFAETVGGSGTAYNGFVGVGILLGPVGLKLTMEMSYSSIGMFYAGGKFGLRI